MKRSATALLVAGLLAALAVPVYAGGLGGGQPVRSQFVQVETDAGYVGASWNSEWGDDFVVAYWYGPDWFRCASYGFDAVMPSVRPQGPDRISVSGSFAPEDFDECWGSPELWDISFDFDVDADYAVVSQSRGMYNEQVIHGDQDWGMDYAFRSHNVSGYDVTAIGTMYGDPINTTSYGQFGSGSFQSEGP